MKRMIKRVADILRVTGIVLLCLALVLSIYITASIYKPWSTFSGALKQQGVSVNFADRLRFDGAYYGALSRAASEKGQETDARAAHVRPFFEGFAARADAAAQAGEAGRVSALWDWFDNEFDADAFLEVHSQAEGGEEKRALSDIFEYLDGLVPAPGKGKAAKLKAASVAPWFEENYAAFAEAQGEDAGTYVEYMSAVKRMVEAFIADGGTVKDVKAWMGSAFTPEAYIVALEAVRGEERSEAAAAITDQLAGAIAEGDAPGKALRGIWAALSAEKPALNEGDFLADMQALLPDAEFDGSAKSVEARMAQLAEARAASGFAAFLDGWCADLVTEADNRSPVGVIAAFWWVVSRFIGLWILGAALVALGLIIDKLLARHMLSQVDHECVRRESDVLLRVDHLCQYFRSGDHVTKAVDDVSFFVRRGEVFGLVGESGCGKTTTGRTIINLYDPTSGDVYFDGLRISSGKNGLPVLRYTLRRDASARIDALRDGLKEKLRNNPSDAQALKAQCAKEIREVRDNLRRRLIEAQDAALEAEAEKNKATQFYRQQRREQLMKAYEADAANLTGAALEERKRRLDVELKAVAKDNVMTRMQMIFQDPIASIDPRMTVREIIAEGLHIRGIHDKKLIDRKVYEMLDLVGLVSEHADRYPHEFSGGQRQRIGIARAIALEPELIIADEPISALDVSIQAQVINLLNDLRKRMGLTIIFIAHNLSVVKYFSDRIAVMYYGNIVEMTTAEELFEHPLHPYTRSLLSAIPYPDPHYEKQRKRLEYNPARAHDYSVDKPSLREITPGHWIRCNDAEFEKYRGELGL